MHDLDSSAHALQDVEDFLGDRMIVSTDMLIDTVDDQDNVIGTIKRSDALRQHANFRVVHLLLFNHEGKLLLQQLAYTRERHPGAWGSSVAAYVRSGESYRQAAQRRLLQELGITTSLDDLGKTSMIDEASKKFITVYAGTTDGPFAYDHDHIAQLDYREIADVNALQASGARTFTPTFLHVLNFYQALR